MPAPIPADPARNYPALSSAAERLHKYPIRPPIPISTAGYEPELAQFTALITAGDYGGAYRYANNNGLSIRTIDVSGGVRAAVVAFMQRNFPRSSGNDGFDDSGGGGAWGN